MKVKLNFFCILYIIFLHSIVIAQNKPTISLGVGANTFESDTENYDFVNPDFGINIGFFTPFLSKEMFNLGLNLSGSYSFVDNDYSNLPTVIPIAPLEGLSLETSSSSVNQSLLQFGFGPQLNIKLGKNIWFSPIVQGGYFKFDQDELALTQNATFNERLFTTDVFRQNAVSEDGFFVKPALRLSYQISKQWNVWGESSYFIADASTTQNQLIPAGKPNEQGQYFFDQIIGDAAIDPTFETTEHTTNLNNLGVSFGLAYSFGVKNGNEDMSSTQKAQDYNSSRSNKPNTIAVDPDNGGAEKHSDESHSNPYFVNPLWSGEMLSIKNSGSIVFMNPAKEKAEKKNKQRKLVNVLPKNNSHFNTENEIKKFSWKVIGTKISNPQFILEVTKIGNNQQSQRIYIEKTSKTSLGATNIFKENKISDGQYRWKVTETTTGISSNPSFFTMTQCEIDFTISNEEIECLGYEQENRKFKICFDVTYASTSGDLTFVNPGSGLSVYDQTYAALSYTLVSPNPTLVVQIGASTTTVSYCFEVTVSASVTGIGFGLQGDDLDPSPITCQPGVSSSFDELPDCICDECEEIELSFDDFNISLNGGTGNQFNFNGNINVNVPIYGIEFQVQSYSYTTSPSACSDGVNSVEESGMILMPGTSINGSTTLEIPNETISGSPSSNDNASKFVKYTSNTALTGAIPINLTIGLPGPLDGLDPSCCLIEYAVCIKVRIFYEDDNCKSCVFTHCFNFNNQ